MADVKMKDKWAGNEMHKCEDEGNKGCASLFGPLRLFLAALFFSLSVNAEYSFFFSLPSPTDREMTILKY